MTARVQAAQATPAHDFDVIGAGLERDPGLVERGARLIAEAKQHFARDHLVAIEHLGDEAPGGPLPLRRYKVARQGDDRQRTREESRARQ
jgi:hypothetical protein